MRQQQNETLQVVIVWILRHASVEKRPREVVDCVLLVFDGPRHNLGVEVIVQTVIKMRLQPTTATDVGPIKHSLNS